MHSLPQRLQEAAELFLGVRASGELSGFLMCDHIFIFMGPQIPVQAEPTMDPAAARRLGVLCQHLAPGDGAPAQLTMAPTAGMRNSTNQTASTSYASIDGRPSSYARVHGHVSRAPAEWRKIPIVAKEKLEEVIYEKAEDEGICKVGL